MQPENPELDRARASERQGPESLARPREAREADGELIRGRPQAASLKHGQRLRARLSSLERLLDDDSKTVWEAVRKEIAGLGRAAEPMLRRASADSRPRARARARAVLLEQGREEVTRRLIRFASPGQNGAEFDLETGLFLLARHHTPDLDVRPYIRALDAMARQVESRFETGSSEKESREARCRALCSTLGTDLGYGNSSDDFHHPDNLHLHRVIERRSGLPLSLTAIYLFVARRLKLRVAALPLPGHVMLRAYGDHEPVIVDPYHHGHVRTERECLQYLEQHGLRFRPEWFRDADDRTLFERQVRNLMRTYELRGMKSELRGIRRLKTVLERYSPSTSQRSRSVPST